METSLYLFTIAATISVPPVLPFAEKTNPNPTPQKQPPIMMDMKGSPWISGSLSKISKTDNEKERESTPKMVFIKNFSPSIFNATDRRATLMIK